MIQPLRTAHRRTFAAMAVILPAIVAAGISLRWPRPAERRAKQTFPARQFVMKKSDRMWQKHALVTEFYGDVANPEPTYVVLRPSGELNEPDLLLYWTGREMEGDTLPGDARLLGAFAPGKMFALGADGHRSGRLVLYSGAHQSIVDTSRVEKLP